ncbi:molybdopterin-dependent oxidoreductase [Streptomyces sp. NPDC058067]|uniref:molybdopterin-dependent oxidoreductase n=1 Tax=Streptomyces sp. NPDC058067 TaxID=3346324 RepID=UPI0036E29B06
MTTPLRMDGVEVEVPDGATLLDAARAAGVELPSLCHDDRLRPAASGRTCLVQAGGRTVAACVTPAEPGMTVDTVGEAVRNLRRDAVALIASALPPHALADASLSELAQNNVQGASDIGALPDPLPGYGPVTDPAARARAEAVWGRAVPPAPGLRIPEMFEAARKGRLKALWITGEDACATDPDSRRVAEALDACPLVVVNELFLGETARHADVVLPVASWLEKDGTFVNFDRRFQRVRAAVRPPGTARSDFAVVQAVATAMGSGVGCPTPAEALAECAAGRSRLRRPLTRSSGPGGCCALALPLAGQARRSNPVCR